MLMSYCEFVDLSVLLGGVAMQPKSENVTVARQPTGMKKWSRPGLRRLPIAATAQSSKPGGNSNDGGGGGKGEVAGQPVS
jgi:hypothetical protein